MLKLCIVGLGSMGKRHLANISRLLSGRNEEFYIDVLRSNGGNGSDHAAGGLVRKEYYSINDLPCNYDVVFLCNPTALHFNSVRELVGKTKHMFIEKPIFDKIYTDTELLNLFPGGVYYVACPLRYTGVIQYLKQFVSDFQVFGARVICSTYLPDWRPNTDYRTNYSSRKELGGGVSIDLIHEWDYLTYLFGLPDKVMSMQGKYSDLEIDSDDMAVYLGQYHNKLISVHLDYFGRVQKREIELYTAGDVVVGDLINKEIRFLKSGKTIVMNERRDDYQIRELETFFDLIQGKKENPNSIQTAVEVLRIALGEYR